MAIPRPASEVRCVLGEGPLWSSIESVLYWIDIAGRHLHRLGEGESEPRSWSLPTKPGCLALREGGGLLVALATGVHAFDLESGALSLVVAPEPDQPSIRLNDGAADMAGRLWVGSMDDAEKSPDAGSLYRIDLDGSVTAMLTGLGVSNGVGWSPDGTTMYHTDSTTRTIRAYAFDAAAGTIDDGRTFVVDDDCYPDGLTVDADGYVWSAKWDGWRVVRYDPAGKIDRVLPMPVQRPTAVAFGGPELDRLYVTSARANLSPSALAAGPLAGALLVIDDLDVRGRPEPPCRL
jgi:L-arabinonolactonase